MAINRGKQFEKILQDQFTKIKDCAIIRLYDTTNGFAGINNPCDFIVFKKPYMLLLEVKSKGTNTLNFESDIRKNQWEGLERYAKINGIKAGVICWFTEKDITKYFPIEYLIERKNSGAKSVSYVDGITVKGKKKRVLFDYELDSLLKEVLEWNY